MQPKKTNKHSPLHTFYQSAVVSHFAQKRFDSHVVVARSFVRWHHRESPCEMRFVNVWRNVWNVSIQSFHCPLISSTVLLLCDNIYLSHTFTHYTSYQQITFSTCACVLASIRRRRPEFVCLKFSMSLWYNDCECDKSWWKCPVKRQIAARIIFERKA